MLQGFEVQGEVAGRLLSLSHTGRWPQYFELHFFFLPHSLPVFFVAVSDRDGTLESLLPLRGKRKSPYLGTSHAQPLRIFASSFQNMCLRFCPALFQRNC